MRNGLCLSMWSSPSKKNDGNTFPSLRAVQTYVGCLNAMVVQTGICCQRFGIAEKDFWQEKGSLCFEMMDFQTSLY